MLRRVHRVAGGMWAALACGAGLGFAARDLAGAEQPVVALAWMTGALAVLVPAVLPARVRAALGRAARRSRSEEGQSSVEWTGLVLAVALALGAVVAFGPRIDGWSFGGFLAHHFTCAVKGGCRDGDRALVDAYGERDGARVREYAPNLVYEEGERQLPVDWRRCRRPRCANAPDESNLDAHRTDTGERATVFTHLLRKNGRTYIQYWLYYPDSNSVWAASDKLWEALWLVPRLQGILRETPPYPGFHRDDCYRIQPMSSTWLGYHRISRVGDRPDTPVSEGEAERAIGEFAERKGLTVQMLPVEKNVSGGQMQRPILTGAIEAIERGEAAGIIVPHLDRLSRAELVDALSTIARIEEAGGQVASVREDFDTTLPEGRQARNMSLLMASGDLDRKKLYLRASKKSAVERGVWPFPLVPIGYTCTRRKEGGTGKLEADPTTAPVVVAAFEARANGASWATIAKRLGVGMSHASKIVANPVYLGTIRLVMADGDTFENPDAHPALVPRDLFEAAQINHPPPAKKGNPRALLAGLCVCASCGGRMTPNTDSKGRNYRCTGVPRAGGKKCGAPAIIGKQKIEDYVIAVVLPYLADAQVRVRARTDHLKELEAALKAAEDERDAYANLTRVTDIAGEAFIAGMRSRQLEVEKTAADLGRARAQLPTIPGAKSVGELWEGFDVEKRRLLLSGALAGVVVQKGRGPAKDRVRLVAQGFDIPSGPIGRDADLEGEIRPLAGK